MNFDELDREMRSYERSIDLVLPPDVYLVARLDGRGFTRLTKEVCPFKAPFDERFRDMMVHTVKYLMDCGFRVNYGFTQSDEISLLFHPEENTFGRKVRKYNSILAGEASAAFSLQLGRPAAMDCRMVPLPTVERVQDYFRWRQEDAYRNALNAHCYWQLRKEGKSVQEATNALKGQTTEFKNDLLLHRGINFEALPTWQKRGIGIWRETIQKEGYNPVTGKTQLAERRAIQVAYELPEREEYAELVKHLLTGALRG
jgi:tRNA(His) 5'-end guanylyltransferase